MRVRSAVLSSLALLAVLPSTGCGGRTGCDSPTQPWGSTTSEPFGTRCASPCGARLWPAPGGAMLGGMIIVFEVHLAPNRESDDFLSAELLEETQAQVMTTAQALAVGFEGMPDDPNVRLVAVAHRDRKFVAGALERAHDVVGFRAHEVDM